MVRNELKVENQAPLKMKMNNNYSELRKAKYFNLTIGNDLELAKLFIGFIIIATLSSCKNSTDNSSVNQEFGYLPVELVEKLEQIAPKLQEFTINPSKSNTIIGESGTFFLIPENVIVDQENNVVTSEVKIVLREHWSKRDYLLSNLQTVAEKHILESGGMIYFNAFDSKGNVLKIIKGKSIRVELPTPEKLLNPKIYLGKRDETGIINWGDMIEPNKSMVTYPILYISQHHLPEGYATECPDYYGMVTSNVSKNDAYYYIQDDILKYENTLLATKEFMMRYQVDCSPELVNMYISNLDKNMWEIDQMMVDFYCNNSAYDDRYFLNGKAVNIPKEQLESPEWVIQREVDGYETFISLFRGFARQKLGKVNPNFVADTAIIANYIDSYESYNNVYRAKTAFDALEFGWINLDVIYNDPKASEINLNVLTNEKASNVTLILKDREVLINAYHIKDNSFSFTKKDKGYNKLHMGAKAVLVAIGFKNEDILFAMKEITIGQNVTENLNLKAITALELEERLAALNN